MATRMTTLAYSEAEPFNHGNRPDAEIDPGASGEHPRLLPTIEMRAYEPRQAHVEDLDSEPFPLAPSAEAFALDSAELDEDTQPSLRSPEPAPSPAASTWQPGNPGRAVAHTSPSFGVEPVALPSILIALATAAAILVGLALLAIVVAWASALSTGAYVVLLGSAVYLLGVGITALIASPTFRFS